MGLNVHLNCRPATREEGGQGGGEDEEEEEWGKMRPYMPKKSSVSGKRDGFDLKCPTAVHR